jgi:hypothetical protein
MSFATLLSVLLFALHWRLALCVSGSSALAMVLVYAVPWLEGVQGLALGLLGLGVGMVWEGGAKKPPSSRPAPAAPTPTGVARTCALIVGAGWGACSAGSMQAFLAGAVILGLAAWAWRGYAGAMQLTWPRPHVHRCIGLAALAYGVAATVVHLVRL